MGIGQLKEFAAKYLKPYQGLKQIKWIATILMVIDAAKYLKPYQGLKHLPAKAIAIKHAAAKYLKPYQGLKHGDWQWVVGREEAIARRKIPKTLSGIETTGARF